MQAARNRVIRRFFGQVQVRLARERVLQRMVLLHSRCCMHAAARTLLRQRGILDSRATAQQECSKAASMRFPERLYRERVGPVFSDPTLTKRVASYLILGF